MKNAHIDEDYLAKRQLKRGTAGMMKTTEFSD